MIRRGSFLLFLAGTLVLGVSPAASEIAESEEAYSEALDAFQQGRFDESVAKARHALEVLPKDQAEGRAPSGSERKALELLAEYEVRTGRHGQARVYVENRPAELRTTLSPQHPEIKRLQRILQERPAIEHGGSQSND